tara:strand:+ start:6283 stop:6984 length:702 start_codon:yes stop_codon:yes gene_type:complete
MSNNRFKIFYSSTRGCELNSWLLGNRDKLKNQRIFYVVRAALDKEREVYKIGISEQGDNSAISRLYDYVHFYGVTNKKNSCQGVRLHLVMANTYNPDVEAKHAAVRRLETKVKAEFADRRERGEERIHCTIHELFDYLATISNIEDVEKKVRQTPRLLEKGQASNEAVDSIVGHEKTRRGVTKYEVHFMKGFKYDKNDKQIPFERENKFLTYDEIIQLRHGKIKIDQYIKNNT